MDDVFNSGREQEDDMYEIIADADIGPNDDADIGPHDDADIDDDDGSRYLNDSGEGMFEEGEEQDLQLTTKSVEVYIYKIYIYKASGDHKIYK
jgi:hypothetical protein